MHDIHQIQIPKKNCKFNNQVEMFPTNAFKLDMNQDQDASFSLPAMANTIEYICCSHQIQVAINNVPLYFSCK